MAVAVSTSSCRCGFEAIGERSVICIGSWGAETGMRIASLDIAGFRNLRQVSLDCAPGLNLLIGPNASGKTSVLEALYVLGRGRSFRARQPRELIQTGAAAFRVVAMMTDGDDRRTPVGIERNAPRVDCPDRRRPDPLAGGPGPLGTAPAAQSR